MTPTTRATACLLVLLAAALSGCAAGTADPPQPIPEDPNPFLYQHAAYPFSVNFAPGAVSPSPAEIGRLQNFLHTASARPGDTVTLSAERTTLGQSRLAGLRDLLARAGLTPSAGVDLSPAPNTVSLVLNELVATAPHCGEWPVFAGDQPSNAPSLFLGCALRNNLYEMVVDKRDLAVGRTPGPADAEPGMRAVQLYREGTPAGAAPSSSQSAGASASGGVSSSVSTTANSSPSPSSSDGK